MRKQVPTSHSAFRTKERSASTFTPSAVSTSAAPLLEESARLPCLATGSPQAAITKVAAEEILKLPLASPPVPQVSMAPGGASIAIIRPRMARTAPVISGTVSPRTRSAIKKPPICEGVASPAIMMSKARRDCCSLSGSPRATIASSAFRSGMSSGIKFPRALSGSTRRCEKIAQQLVAMLRSYGLRVELHPLYRQMAVTQAHDQPIFTFGRHLKTGWKVAARNRKRVIAGDGHRRRDAVKNSLPVVGDGTELPVQRLRCALYAAAERLANRLMTQTDTQQGNNPCRLLDQRKANSGLIRITGAGR